RCPSAPRPVPGGPSSRARPAAWAYRSRAALPVAAGAVFLALSRVLTALTSPRGAVTRHRGDPRRLPRTPAAKPAATRVSERAQGLGRPVQPERGEPGPARGRRSRRRG